MTRRTAAHLAAMVALGLGCFALFGVMVAWRQARPIEPPPGAERSVAGRSPAQVLVQGTLAAAEVADGAGGAGRPEAVTALDAARRLALVGRHALHGRRGWAFAAVCTDLERARLALQRGDTAGRDRAVERAVATLRAARSAGGGTTAPAPDTWDGFEGATVVNALGQRVGELDHLTRVGGEAWAVLRIGGVPDVFGILDLGNPTWVSVPATSLVYGDPAAAGPVTVVVASFGTEPADLVTTRDT